MHIRKPVIPSSSKLIKPLLLDEVVEFQGDFCFLKRPIISHLFRRTKLLEKSE